MALTDENNGMAYSIPVQPMGGNGFGNGFGGDGAWLILFLLLLCNNGWGNGFGGGNVGGDLYPWMNQSNQMNDGFRDQMINSNITGIQNAVTSGFGQTNRKKKEDIPSPLQWKQSHIKVIQSFFK